MYRNLHPPPIQFCCSPRDGAESTVPGGWGGEEGGLPINQRALAFPAREVGGRHGSSPLRGVWVGRDSAALVSPAFSTRVSTGQGSCTSTVHAGNNLYCPVRKGLSRYHFLVAENDRGLGIHSSKTWPFLFVCSTAQDRFS